MMKKESTKFRIEFSTVENFSMVDEWQTIDGLEVVEAETAEDAAKWAACTDGLENALFRVLELIFNEFGLPEPLNQHEAEFFCFVG